MLKTILIIALSAHSAASTAPVKEAGSGDSEMLYTLGYLLGRNLMPFDLKPNEFKPLESGLRDAAAGAKPKHNLSQTAPKIEEWAGKRQSAKAGDEKKRAQAWLDKMGKEKGAQVSPTGLVFIPLREGTGPSPASTDSVKAHYEGRLWSGMKFDSSYDRGAPTDFSLASVIRCWTEGIPKMKVGGKARLICPSDIGYGDEGNPPAKIPGGAPLDFTVELLGINK